MIDSKVFYDTLIRNGLSFFTGVPDSLLKDFCACVTERTDAPNHIIAANEGNAIALATGYYLATNRFPVIYMQNSGLGNAINPLTSLVDSNVYNIPMLLIIGWRGEPGKQDAPQHIKQGEITLPLLKTLGIEYCVLPDNLEEAVACLRTAINQMRTSSRPYAFVIRKGTFEPYALKTQATSYEMQREDAVKIIADSIGAHNVIVSATGKVSRELFEYRIALGGSGSRQDFMMVGSMGHASQIALGIALVQPDKQVFCLDGDGALIMHMGALVTIGSQHPVNLRHIVINNGVHDSVGGQPTAGFNMDMLTIARACGYAIALRAETRSELKTQLDILMANHGVAFLEVRVNKGSRSDLGRPTITPVENKINFMKFLQT